MWFINIFSKIIWLLCLWLKLCQPIFDRSHNKKNLIGFSSCQLSHWDCQGNLCKKPFSTCISRREFLSFNLGLWDKNEISTIFENGIFLKMCLSFSEITMKISVFKARTHIYFSINFLFWDKKKRKSEDNSVFENENSRWALVWVQDLITSGWHD